MAHEGTGDREFSISLLIYSNNLAYLQLITLLVHGSSPPKSHENSKTHKTQITLIFKNIFKAVSLTCYIIVAVKIFELLSKQPSDLIKIFLKQPIIQIIYFIILKEPN